MPDAHLYVAHLIGISLPELIAVSIGFIALTAVDCRIIQRELQRASSG